MSDLENALDEIWDETRVDAAPFDFNAGVFEQVARRKARAELGVAALIALAVWAIALGLEPMLTPLMTEVGLLMASMPVLAAIALVGAGLGLVALMQFRPRLDRDWWTLGLRG